MKCSSSTPMFIYVVNDLSEGSSQVRSCICTVRFVSAVVPRSSNIPLLASKVAAPPESTKKVVPFPATSIEF